MCDTNRASVHCYPLFHFDHVQRIKIGISLANKTVSGNKKADWEVPTGFYSLLRCNSIIAPCTYLLVDQYHSDHIDILFFHHRSAYRDRHCIALLR